MLTLEVSFKLLLHLSQRSIDFSLWSVLCSSWAKNGFYLLEVNDVYNSQSLKYMVHHRKCLLIPGPHHHLGQHKSSLKKKKKSYRCRLNRPIWEAVKFEVFKTFNLISNQSKGKRFSSFLVKIYYFLRNYWVCNLNILKAVMESIIC